MVKGVCADRLPGLPGHRRLGGHPAAGGARDQTTVPVRLLLSGLLRDGGEVLPGVPLQNQREYNFGTVIGLGGGRVHHNSYFPEVQAVYMSLAVSYRIFLLMRFTFTFAFSNLS